MHGCMHVMSYIHNIIILSSHPIEAMYTSCAGIHRTEVSEGIPVSELPSLWMVIQNRGHFWCIGASWDGLGEMSCTIYRPIIKPAR